jgi:hypothetical protein
MGENLIIALIFIFVSLTMIGSDAQFQRHNMQNNNLQSSIVLEAKELKTFADAAFDYGESFNVPLSAKSFTVSNLQSYGLLPSTFPQITPFGQGFQADYAEDSCNSNVMDLLVKTSGSYNNDLLAKNGIKGTIGINYINSEVDKTLNGLNISYQNANNPCVSNGQPDYIGSTVSGSSSLNLYGGGTAPTSVTSNNLDSAIYIYAPNQWGYLVFSFEFGFMSDWGVTNGNVATINQTITSQPGVITVSGWNTQCPVGGVVISPGQTYTNTYSGSNIFFRKLWCIPAYKSQVNSFVNSGIENTRQVLNYGLSASVYFGNYYIYGTEPSTVYMGAPVSSPSYNSSVEYIDPSNISGLNNNIYAVQNYFQSYPPYNPIPNGSYPGSNFIPMAPLYNIFATSGLDINVGAVTWQIATWDYDFITGTGVSPAAAGINSPNTEGQSFPAGATIWQDSSGDNLGSSYMNYGGGYYVTSNPTNTSNYAGTISYLLSNSGPTTGTVNFTIPTPQIN